MISKLFKKIFGNDTSNISNESSVSNESEWIVGYENDEIIEYKVVTKFGLLVREHKDGTIELLKPEKGLESEGFEEDLLVIDHCKFKYSEMKYINNVLCGKESLFFILDESGIPCSTAFWEEDFEEAEMLDFKETEYFEWNRQKTFFKELSVNLTNSVRYSYGKVYCIKKETGELSDILVNHQGSRMTIVDKNHNPLINPKTKDVVCFGDIYFEDGAWKGESGTSVYILNDQGFPIDEKGELCAY